MTATRKTPMVAPTAAGQPQKAKQKPVAAVFVDPLGMTSQIQAPAQACLKKSNSFSDLRDAEPISHATRSLLSFRITRTFQESNTTVSETSRLLNRETN